MKDPRYEIMQSLMTLLSGHDLDVYNTVPSNTAQPFIFIGSINLDGQVLNKSSFEYQGRVDVELYTGDNSWTGSLADPYRWLNDIKVALQPTPDFVLPLATLHMVWWRLDSDTDFTDISDTEKHYIVTVTYQFEISQINTEVQAVIHNGEAVTHNGEAVTKLINTNT